MRLILTALMLNVSEICVSHTYKSINPWCLAVEQVAPLQSLRTLAYLNLDHAASVRVSVPESI
jgi:hypothetical protein